MCSAAPRPARSPPCARQSGALSCTTSRATTTVRRWRQVQAACRRRHGNLPEHAAPCQQKHIVLLPTLGDRQHCEDAEPHAQLADPKGSLPIRCAQTADARAPRRTWAAGVPVAVRGGFGPDPPSAGALVWRVRRPAGGPCTPEPCCLQHRGGVLAPRVRRYSGHAPGRQMYPLACA